MTTDYRRTSALATLRAKYGASVAIKLLPSTTDLWVEATVNLERIKGREQQVKVCHDGRVIEG